MVNATDVLQPKGIIVLTLFPSPACLDVPTLADRYPHVPHDARDPGNERWHYVGEN